MFSIDNLTKLRDWLSQNRNVILNSSSFSMADYILFEGNHGSDEKSMDEILEGCNSSACVLGWAKLSGLFPLPSLKAVLRNRSKWWLVFARNFIPDLTPERYTSSEAWNFLFSQYWSDDLDEAIARLDYVIKNNNIPPEWEYASRYASSL